VWSDAVGAAPLCSALFVLLLSMQIVQLAWDAGSRLLAAAAGNDVLVW